MEKNYNFVGEPILNEFTVPHTTDSDTLSKLFKEGWLIDVFIDVKENVFIGKFAHLYAN